MAVEEYFGDWMKVIDRRELDIVLHKINMEYSRRPVCPNKVDIFKAFRLCSLKDLKVVMIGQDPYPQKGIATGILFGNRANTDEEKLSPSLKIVKEAVINFDIPHYCINFDPTLESWASQGILMLNSSLTVGMNKIGSHIMMWRPFISKLLENLSRYDTALVYVLFGKQAQTFKPYIRKDFNHILEVPHPSYYSRTKTNMPKSVFDDINKIITGIYGSPIIWYKENMDYGEQENKER